MMRLALYIFFPLIVILANNVSAHSEGQVRITGHAPGHAGDEIIFYNWTNQVSFTETELFRFTVDEDEGFSLEFKIDTGPKYIFSDIGSNYLYMYIEPGEEYQILLPDKTDKSPWEKLNPYFQGIPTHIAILKGDSSRLNSMISNFDMMYEPLFGNTLISLTINRDEQMLDSIMTVFDQTFNDSTNQYFNNYRKYKMALLGIMSQMQSAKNVSDNFFRNDSVLYDNVAYMEVFNQVYNKYFQFFSRTPRGRRIFEDINRNKSLDSLRITLQTDPVLGGDRLLEMVILKGLHDAFYGSEFSRSSLLVVLDSLAATTVYPEHEMISGHIREKVTRLLTGFNPPDFQLMNSDGELVSISDYLGYYVYLNFCTGASYGCLSEFEVLSRLAENHTTYLKLVTVFIDDSFEAMQDFLKRYDYKWDFLYYGTQPSILKDYNIRMFPEYYLVDRDGTLLMSPAPSPADNFELYLLRTMRSRREVR